MTLVSYDGLEAQLEEAGTGRRHVFYFWLGPDRKGKLRGRPQVQMLLFNGLPFGAVVNHACVPVWGRSLHRPAVPQVSYAGYTVCFADGSMAQLPMKVNGLARWDGETLVAWHGDLLQWYTIRHR